MNHDKADAILRSEDLMVQRKCAQYHLTVYHPNDTGCKGAVLVDYPENTTTIAPLTPYDKWDGEKFG